MITLRADPEGFRGRPIDAKDYETCRSETAPTENRRVTGSDALFPRRWFPLGIRLTEFPVARCKEIPTSIIFCCDARSIHQPVKFKAVLNFLLCYCRNPKKNDWILRITPKGQG
jgi:hypothetical protein